MRVNKGIELTCAARRGAHYMTLELDTISEKSAQPANEVGEGAWIQLVRNKIAYDQLTKPVERFFTPSASLLEHDSKPSSLVSNLVISYTQPLCPIPNLSILQYTLIGIQWFRRVLEPLHRIDNQSEYIYFPPRSITMGLSTRNQHAGSCDPADKDAE